MAEAQYYNLRSRVDPTAFGSSHALIAYALAYVRALGSPNTSASPSSQHVSPHLLHHANAVISCSAIRRYNAKQTLSAYHNTLLGYSCPYTWCVFKYRRISPPWRYGKVEIKVDVPYTYLISRYAYFAPYTGSKTKTP